MNRFLMCVMASMLSSALAVPLFAQDAAKIDRGKMLFTAQKCSLCHSIDGKGNKKGLLDGIGSKLSSDDIRKWIVSAKEMAAKAKATRQPPMKDYSTLAPADVDALVAYMSSLKTP